MQVVCFAVQPTSPGPVAISTMDAIEDSFESQLKQIQVDEVHGKHLLARTEYLSPRLNLARLARKAT